MLSRVADTIYWLGRYMERTNGMLQVILTQYISSQDDADDFQWRSLIKIYGELTDDEIKSIETSSSKALAYMIFSRTNSASAYNNVMFSRENARGIQDHITKEVWQCLNDYYHYIRDDNLRKEASIADPVSSIDFLIRNGLLFTGTVDNTMTRGEGFTFINIGKFIERAIHSTDITRIKMNELRNDPHEGHAAMKLRYLLYSLFGFEVYLKTYKGNFTTKNTLDLILYNPDFPHSILYSIERLYKYFGRLREESLHENYERLEFLIGKVMNNIKYSNLHESDIKTLDAFLFQIRLDLFEISAAFSKHYFGNS
ncbi:MAG: alpha-E domain-containing protein [Bacteroidota bacterium]|nr:alpha-E domain-containing protein [Bacteroidota bacterium]